MKLYYRISDNSYKKQKLIGATKEVCLINFMKAFHEIPMTIIADKCSEETHCMLSEVNKNHNTVSTDYGNAGSLRHAIELAISECEDNEVIYFAEDDYLHLRNSPTLIKEGIKRSEYVTLYDHPDKYTSQYNGGEFSKVIKTESSHWRYTISTCMTFGSTVKTLKEDLDIWKKFTNETHPHDHLIFKELGKEKRRRLAVCIPGAACHTDLEYSQRTKKMLIEPWAIQLMIDQLRKEIGIDADADWIARKSGTDRLLALDALRKNGM
jgi:hypothetical protein